MKPERLRVWINAFGGRRFLLCVSSGIVHIVLLMRHYIDPSVFAELILGTIGAYIAGDVVDNRRKAAQDYSRVDDPDVR